MTIRVWLALAACIASAWGTSLDVPYVRQERQGCGPAAVAMVMQYWAKQGARLHAEDAAEAAIYRRLYRPELRGSSGEDMAAYLRRHGFAAFDIDGSWSDLVEGVERGRPLIVCLGPSRHAPFHYVVVIGVEGSRVVFHDPARRARVVMDAQPFQAAWQNTGNWMLIATPERIE